jgi:HD superfamily phosphohydrolase
MSRTYRDPVHQEITLNSDDPVEGLVIELIDTREFQRLRWIRQLGTGWFTFHGAEASRFQHSLGTMYIAKLMYEKVSQDLVLDEVTATEYKALVLVAALLHDIGHGPFSHSTEKVNNIMHETWTQALISSESTEIHKTLEKYQAGLSAKVISVLNKTYPVKFLSSIVNSQLDCDRFDYLIRDSFYTGTSYGHFDLNRVISSIKVNLEHDCLVVSGEKGMLAVEDYLYARYSMYMQVYQHKKCLASDSLLLKLFKRAKVLTKGKRIAFIEEPVYNWLIQPEKLSVEDFLLVDDINIMHHIKHWTHEKDVTLKDLARRFIDRDLFKAVKIDNHAEGTIEEKLEEMFNTKSQELRRKNLDPDYYLDSITIASNPYSFYNPSQGSHNADGASRAGSKAIFVEGNDGELREISTLSHVVDSLVKNSFANSWFIYVDVGGKRSLTNEAVFS